MSLMDVHKVMDLFNAVYVLICVFMGPVTMSEGQTLCWDH